MYVYGYKDLHAGARAVAAVKRGPVACAECPSCAVMCPMGFDIKTRVLDILRMRDFPAEFLA